MTMNNWINQVNIAITATDADGIITEMNPASIATFIADGGEKLIGTNVLDCHPEPSRSKLEAMYKAQQPNHYTISKNGQKKIIHQIPLSKDGVFQGFVEISIPIPEHLPHFNRD